MNGIAAAEAAQPDGGAHEGGGNGLLWVLLAVGRAVRLGPAARADGLRPAGRLADHRRAGRPAGHHAGRGAQRHAAGDGRSACWRARTDLRSLALLLAASAALLSALVTNDVSLFLLVPLTRVLATQAHLPLARLVVLEALAVNAGSALTPIGNPQNLYLWHRSGESFVGFMGMMAPTVAVMLFWLFVGGVAAGAAHADRAQARGRRRAGAAAAAGAVRRCCSSRFVVALDRHWLLAGLGVVFGAFLLLHPRVLRGVDWALLAIIALMFVDLRQLAELPAVASLLRRLADRRRLARLPGRDRSPRSSSATCRPPSCSTARCATCRRWPPA